MAIITCPECNGSVSDSALACPHCGYAVAKGIEQSKIYEEKQRIVKAKSSILKVEKHSTAAKITILAMGILIAYMAITPLSLLLGIINSNDSEPSAIKTTQPVKVASYKIPGCDDEKIKEKITGTAKKAIESAQRDAAQCHLSAEVRIYNNYI